MTARFKETTVVTHPDTRYFLRAGKEPLTRAREANATLPFAPNPKVNVSLFETRSAARWALRNLLIELRRIHTSLIADSKAFREAHARELAIAPDSVHIVTIPATDRGRAACKRLGVAYEEELPTRARTQKTPTTAN